MLLLGHEPAPVHELFINGYKLSTETEYVLRKEYFNLTLL